MNELRLLPNERVILTADSDSLTLTTHRVRQEIRETGYVAIRSAMLDEICFCEYVRESKPFLLTSALLIAVLTLIAAGRYPAGTSYLVLAAGLSVAGVALVAWLATRRAFLNLATAAGSIPIRVRQMKYEDLEDFISELEQAKNNRFLLRTISFG
ncbi:MAG TPA: hypothetical protein VFD58_28655 [Blastocatellia bacterium]|nr:hypothetical protein [Blastocatellia bacterium]